MTKVYDLDGVERDLAWLAREFNGCAVLEPVIGAGVKERWVLETIYVTTGPAVFKGETANATNQPVAFTWPDLDNPDPEAENMRDVSQYQTAWADRAVVQRTDPGVTGFGLGSSYGPLYHAWVLSSAPSDCLTRTGMKGGTNHTGPLHAVWRLVQIDVDPSDPPEPEPDHESNWRYWHMLETADLMINGTRAPETIAKRSADLIAAVDAEAKRRGWLTE